MNLVIYTFLLILIQTGCADIDSTPRGIRKAPSANQVPTSSTSPSSSPSATARPETNSNHSEAKLEPQNLSLLAMQKFGKRIGAAVSRGGIDDPSVKKVILDNFNTLTPENELKFNSTEPQRGVFDFSQAKPILDFARANKIDVHGHVLIWHHEAQLPDWVKAQGNNPAELEKILAAHVKGVVTELTKQYGDLISSWDVVNEAVSDFFGMRNTIWKAIGNGNDDYIKIAFRAAREANPNIKLYYNDYLAEGLSFKSDAVYELVKRLKAEGVPIDGVGLQMHRNNTYWPHSISDIEANIKRLSDLGMEVRVSELDYMISDSQVNDQTTLGEQAKFYYDVTKLCMKMSACKALTTWGVSDRSSWIPYSFPGNGSALMFDTNERPKATYFSVLKALTE